jgi:triacylglycerol esterase/lipase EstA (alpha/beta hydrolase family)
VIVMISRCTVHKNLLKAAIVLVATSALAQAPPKYDATAETKLKGVVEELKFVPPAGGKPVAYLVVKSGADSVSVFLGPKSFLESMGASFKAGEAVEVTGSKVKQDGADVILAREVAKGDDNLTLRFKDGKPAW